jgi:hypothetical protein
VGVGQKLSPLASTDNWSLVRAQLLKFKTVLSICDENDQVLSVQFPNNKCWFVIVYNVSRLSRRASSSCPVGEIKASRRVTSGLKAHVVPLI